MPAPLRPPAPVQPFARWAMGLPAGDPKKTDARVTQEQLDNFDKFKGGCCFWILLFAVVGSGTVAATAWFAARQEGCYLLTPHTLPTDVLPACPAPGPLLPAESAYKCGVQICFTVVLLLVGLNKP